MKKLVLIGFVLFVSEAKATTYYFSASAGNDSRTELQAQHPATAWKTISRLNAFFSNLKGGDSVLFKRGDIFYGAIVVNRSGSNGHPIIISAYGSGAKPIISGLTTLSSWSSLGKGIYQSACPSAQATVDLVTINGVNTPMGRWPNRDASNKGWRIINAHAGNTVITDNSLPGSLNFIGGKAVFRTTHSTMNAAAISRQSGNTVTLLGGGGLQDGYGYFIQGHPGTLDQFGEWYFNASAKTMQVYFGEKKPASFTVRASTVDKLVYCEGNSYITFDQLSFQGSNQHSLYIHRSSHITIQNCDINYSGDYAISCEASPYSTITNCMIQNSNNSAVFVGVDFNNTGLGGSPNSVIKNNTIRNTGIHPGMGRSFAYFGIDLAYSSDNSVIEGNKVTNTGHNGIQFYFSNGVDIKNNVVDSFCMEKDDGGGIYTYTGPKNGPFTGIKIRNNIVLNGIGATESRNDKSYIPANGIYMDDNTSGVEISGNTVANCASSGIYIHLSHEITLLGNTIYNNGFSQLQMGNYGETALRNIAIYNNIFFSRTATQYSIEWDTPQNDVPNFGTADSNYYVRPVDDNLSFRIVAPNAPPPSLFNLRWWKSYSGQDAYSNNSPKSLAGPAGLRFEYNTTAVAKQVNLGGSYMDVRGTVYKGTITLLPYSSVVLINTALARSPASNPGAGMKKTTRYFMLAGIGLLIVFVMLKYLR